MVNIKVMHQTSKVKEDLFEHRKFEGNRYFKIQKHQMFLIFFLYEIVKKCKLLFASLFLRRNVGFSRKTNKIYFMTKFAMTEK